jgi:N-formylglutamate amidohydrolase
METGLAWIDAGRSFGFDDLVHWHGKGSRPFDQIAQGVDTILCGPHSSAAFPAELQQFINPNLTRRKQFDFSDVSIAALGRAWVAADPAVVYIENPYSRVVLDPNRAPVAKIEPGLRQAFDALSGRRPGQAVSLAGFDMVRPITFSGEDVLIRPEGGKEWAALVAALEDCADRGPRTYARLRDGLIDSTLAQRVQPNALTVLSLHDTMNTQMTADGAITLPRPAGDELPWLMNLGNRGDDRGEGPADELTMRGAELRRLGACISAAWQIAPEDERAAIRLNQPYKGAHEVISIGARLRAAGQERIGAAQVEFLRETLIGPLATSRLKRPGGDWPETDASHLSGLVEKLVLAWDGFRR